MRILGIDPGLAVTGYGILNVNGDKVKMEIAGTFTTAADPMPTRLKQIFLQIQELIEREKPTEAALEEGFYGRNVKVAMSLGQARGAILLACSLKEIPVHEYSPREVKQSVVGRGAASKEQVSYMIKALLGVKELPKAHDVTDALAVAYCRYLRRNIPQ